MADPNVSGFPEWLPEEKISENELIDNIRRTYEEYGYSPIETSAVERLETLLAKGGDDKEVYAVMRHVDARANSAQPEIGLHFDLTVPFARYVTQHQNALSFPFKRFQIQKCWRGERPQEGRYREFCQADVDVVAIDYLPLHFDAETLEIGLRALHRVCPGQFLMSMNNRKLIDGLCIAFGIDGDHKKHLLSGIDKLPKVGVDVCREMLLEKGIRDDCIKFLIDEERDPCDPTLVRQQFSDIPIPTELEQGISEVETVAELIPPDLRDYLKFDVRIVRGLDYYTGTIFEGRLHTVPDLSICAGGRYDDLTEVVGKSKLPGVGISIGISRLFYLLRREGVIVPTTSTPASLLISALSEEQRLACHQIANKLRSKSVPCEEYHNFGHKPGKQIQYANKKGMAFVLFVDLNGDLSLKNLKSRQQVSIQFEDIPDFLN